MPGSWHLVKRLGDHYEDCGRFETENDAYAAMRTEAAALRRQGFAMRGNRAAGYRFATGRLFVVHESVSPLTTRPAQAEQPVPARQGFYRTRDRHLAFVDCLIVRGGTPYWLGRIETEPPVAQTWHDDGRADGSDSGLDLIAPLTLRA